ncbi:MAG TPA: TIGR00299 family protein, partial [Clostridiales bacterium]|nr:TIGR00299 family protein [Clostridiales bacterium]
MGKILYFDCFSGISGDMTAAALLDLGLDQKIFLSELEKLGLGNEYHLDISRGSTYGIEGTSFDVHVHTGDQHHPNEKALPDAHPEPANHGRHLKEVG